VCIFETNIHCARIVIAREVIRRFREVYDVAAFDDLVVDLHID